MLNYLTLHTNAVHLFQQPAAPVALVSKFRAACDDSLRQRVCDSGGWTLRTVPLLLARIKELAVVKIHKSRHLANLYDIVQQPDEPVRAFVACLTGTADMCGMQVQCSDYQQNVSYRDEVVKQMIIHGLVNTEIKQRVLSRTGNDELPTLAELVNYIAAEEISCSESLNVHTESNHFPSVCHSGRPNSRQVSEIEIDPDYEGNICSITAASLYSSQTSLPTTATDLAPIVAEMKTDGPVTTKPTNTP